MKKALGGIGMALGLSAIFDRETRGAHSLAMGAGLPPYEYGPRKRRAVSYRRSYGIAMDKQINKLRLRNRIARKSRQTNRRIAS